MWYILRTYPSSIAHRSYIIETEVGVRVLDHTKLFPGNATAPQYVVITLGSPTMFYWKYVRRKICHSRSGGWSLMHIFLHLYAWSQSYRLTYLKLSEDQKVF